MAEDTEADSKAEPFFYTKRAKQYVDLHDQIETSVGLLDSLEGFLSTFQTDLTAVSGQISTLQDRSKDIENRLKSRKRIEKPLSSLLSDLGIAPSLATTILDTDVDERWLSVIPDFERRLSAVNARKRVKAARDLSEVTEGLRIVAATKIRVFFLTLLQPVRTSMTTNMQVLQTSVLLKYKTLYEFLQNHAEDVAKEVERSYIIAARVYYETGFRRYIRSLGWIKARTTEKSELIGGSDANVEFSVDEARLAHARLDGPPVVQAYIAENKTHKEPLEALFRSMLMVLMDNASAEYTFVTTFFPKPPQDSNTKTSEQSSIPLFSPAYSQELAGGEGRRVSVGTETIGSPPMRRRESLAQSVANGVHSRTGSGPALQSVSKEEMSALTSIWKQVTEPTLNYCQTFANSILDPAPPVIPLLTMIRMMENTLAEVQNRGCAPLENWLFGLRMQFWPVFQKQMTEHVASLTKLTEAVSGGYFRRTTGPSDSLVQVIARRYVAIFWSFIILTETEEETMIFSNLARLRQELTTLIVNQSKRIADPLKSATFQSTLFEMLLQAMSKNQYSMSHPKAQSELAYWREREEESRRRMTSTLTTRQAR
ncbi:Vps52-domain-containing protein [Fomitiporia mediterranea MF3/22]|uniref:Vps52-domain-containing protein n=1 Tax=Fomitiporia mediterranea (strain MF3/22) TaxID=694068 RepID=UPI00044083C5|nr:Vps52-domain-containing protein [Fomitiporia mediterranea MF3/22]EJD01401.1 Vps52-domain-containing protein [Fomitiporia mediterranea MF3/22]